MLIGKQQSDYPHGDYSQSKALLITTPSLNLGFSTHAQCLTAISSGRKKKVHTQSHACAVCLSLQAKLLHLFVRLHAFFRHPKVAWCQGRA